MSLASAAERIWHGDSVGERAGRVVLIPFSLLFRIGIGVRALAYDIGLLRAHSLGVPAISIGNVAIGGTGKTPVAAWIASELRARGAAPAVVMRGVGGDEPLVHRALNVGVPVIVAADRVAGAVRARADGADVLVLDDAFQHRRAKRDVDLVLLSADAARRPKHLLPAGGWREPLSALRRASMVLVTRKAASDEMVRQTLAEVHRAAPSVATGVVRLEPEVLRQLGSPDEPRALATLAGRRVLAVAAIADPGAFLRQLERLGPSRVEPALYPDHHPFEARDVERLVDRAGAVDYVVCTLKDAVKLGPRWPRVGPPLWYVSQRVVPEAGGERLDAILTDLLGRRGRPDRAGRTSGAVPQAS